MRWWLRGFDPDSNAMVEELPMRAPDIEEFRRQFGLHPRDPAFDTYPVTAAQLPFLTRHVDGRIDLDQRDYFVEQNSDPGEVVRVLDWPPTDP